MSKTACQHASYCPLRMRDGDRPGCNWRKNRRDCEPTVERLPTLDLHALFFAKPVKK